MTGRTSLPRTALVLAVTLMAAAPPSIYLAPGKLVETSAATLNFYCTGHGQPVVLLESGLGGRASQWSAVQESLSATTTVCSYDRAGYGFSFLGARPRTSARIADELSAAVDALKLPPPYILVGTSFGTFDLRLFARRRENDVAGAVLVNPSAEQEELVAPTPAIAEIDKAGLDHGRLCLNAATDGTLRTNVGLSNECIGPPDDSPAGAARRKLLEGPNTWSALVSEWENIRKSAQEVADSHQAFGATPLVVISAGVAPDLSALPTPQQDAMRAFWPQWNTWQDQLAALSRKSLHVRTGSADRTTERSNPECVVAAVQTVIAATRHDTALTIGDRLCDK